MIRKRVNLDQYLCKRFLLILHQFLFIKTNYNYYLMDNNCPFCSNTMLHNAFLETRNFLAIYNIAPVLPGHALVISLRHVESAFELSHEERIEMVEFLQKTTKILLKAFRGEGFDWSLQEKECAGQSIPHLHVHVVIRRVGDLDSDGKWYPMVEENDNHLLDSHLRPKLSQNEMISITRNLKAIANQLSEE